MAEAATRQALERMDRSYRDLQSNVEGQASMNALLSLVDSLGALPGRKTVVYFCEGLTVAPAVEAKFRSIIATANRKNVSVYALDAAGLRAHSKQAETRNELNALASSAVSGVERSDNRKWTEDLEVNEQMLKSDPSAALGILTGQTGGLLIENTNDLDRGIGRINDDRRNYYALTYAPTNSALDGTYRKIEVKVKRPGVDVRSRSGYLAVPANEASPVLTFEVPALAAIAATPRPTAFAVQSRALSVPMPDRPGLTAVDRVVHRRCGDLRRRPENQDVCRRRGRARARDRRVRHATGQAEPAVPADRSARRPGRRPRQATWCSSARRICRPGQFTVTTAVHDTKGKRSSVVETSVEVPGGPAPVVGSLFIVSRAERLNPKDPSAASHPLAGAGRPALSVAGRADQQEGAGRDRLRIAAAARRSRTGANGDAGTAAGRPGAGADSAAARQARRHRPADSNQQAALGGNPARRPTTSA